MEQQSTENLDLTVNRKENCVVEFDIDAKPALVKKAREDAIKAISKEVSIPGFRKGKAPGHLIEKRYGKALVDETKKALANTAFKEAQGLVKIPLLNQNVPINYRCDSFSEEKGAKVVISFESEPQVPEISFDTIKVDKVEKPEITDKKIERGLRQIMLVYAEWNQVTDRPVQEGDYVRIDVEDLEADPVEKVMDNERSEVCEEAMPEWMLSLIIGMKAEESKEGVSKPDQDASEADKEEFKPKKVRLTVKGVEEAKLPELTDEFAQKVGAPNVDAFRKHVEEVLERQAADYVKKKERDQISDELLASCDFELPGSILQKETQYRLRGLLYEPAFVKDWQAMNEDERKKAVESITEDAKKAIKLFYICRSIVGKAGIQITPEEIASEIEHPFDPIRNDKMGTKTEAQKEEERALALSRLMLAKAQDHIIEKLRA